MTWTYDSSLSTALSQVRLTVGDTNTNDRLLTDEEINYRLGLYSDDITNASIRCCHDIIAKLARDVDRSNVGMSATRSQKIQHYKDLIIQLKQEAGSLGEVFVGGISHDTEDSYDSDEDFKSQPFSIGMDSNK